MNPTALPQRSHALLSRLWPPGDPTSEVRLSPRTRLAIILVALTSLVRQITALAPPEVYRKDVRYDYLPARALLDGVNPYLPLPELAQRYAPYIAMPEHVSKHPPFVTAVTAPLGLLSYEAAAALWLVAALGLLVALAYVLNARGERPGLTDWRVWCTFGLLLLWAPVWSEVYFGQLNLVLALLLIGCWYAADSRRWRWAGFLLGGAIAIKLFPAVIAGYFLLRRQWGVVVWALLSAGMLTLLGSLIVGGDAATTYFWTGTVDSTNNRGDDANFSLHAAVWRVFAGGNNLAPLVDSPLLGWALSMLASAAVLLIAAWYLVRAGDHGEVSFSTALCAMLLAIPITLQYYLVILAWPIFSAARRLHARGWPKLDTNLWLGGALLMGIPVSLYGLLAVGIGLPLLGNTAAPGTAGAVVLPGVAGLPLLLLPVGPLLLFVALLRLTSEQLHSQRS